HPRLHGKAGEVLPIGGEFTEWRVEPNQPLLDLVERPNVVVADRRNEHLDGIERQRCCEARILWTDLETDSGSQVDALDLAARAFADKCGSPDADGTADGNHDARRSRIRTHDRTRPDKR